MEHDTDAYRVTFIYLALRSCKQSGS